MSMCVAFSLPDGALMVTDGRLLDASTGELSTDTADKITRLGAYALAGRFGVENVAEEVCARLRGRVDHLTGEEVHKRLADAVLEAWAAFTREHDVTGYAGDGGGVYVTVAGLDVNGVPYIAAYGVHHELSEPHSLFESGRDRVHMHIAGHPQDKVRMELDHAVRDALTTHDYAVHVGPVNPLAGALRDASAESIRQAAAADPHHVTGGAIRWGLVRREYGLVREAVRTGTLSADRISGGTISGYNVNLTNLNASNIVSGSLSGDRITGGTITGTTLQTASWGNRAVLAPSAAGYWHSLICYDSGGTARAGTSYASHWVSGSNGQPSAWLSDSGAANHPILQINFGNVELNYTNFKVAGRKTTTVALQPTIDYWQVEIDGQTKYVRLYDYP